VEAFMADGPVVEVTRVKETAVRLANGESPDGADPVRVLAGLVHQLASLVEDLELREPDRGPTAPLSGAEE
jgi:hypothetical protein